MPDPTLKVKNTTAAAVDLELPDGTVKTIAAGDEVDLDQAVLTSPPFATRIIEAKLQLLTPVLSSLTAEQKVLGRAAALALVNALAGRVLGADRAAKDAVAFLGDTRALYNARHDAAKPLLTAAKDTSAGAANLIDAASHFVNVDDLEDAVEAVQAEITAKEAEDLAALNKTLAEWFPERRALQVKLDAAQAALAAAQADFDFRFKDLFESLDTAAVDMDAVDPATDIGAKIPAFP
jgi:hypothetical protein